MSLACEGMGGQVDASSPEGQGASAGSSASASPSAFAGTLPARDPSRPMLDLNRIGYDLGAPGASIKVIEISDFGCGYCRVFNQETFPLLHEEFIKTGRIQWKFVPFVLGMFPNGDRAAVAGECAGGQGDDAFFRMQTRLFSEQGGWKNSEDPEAFFIQLAREEGLDEGRFTACLQGGEGSQRVALDVRAGQALGVRGTPLFIIGGIPVPGAFPVDRFRLILESLLAAEVGSPEEWVPHPPTPDGPSITERVHTAEMGFSRGSPEAPLRVVEFSDFGCGYCRVFQEETRPVLMEEYVDAGLVRWTYMPFVLGIFPNGEMAAKAGECAGDQGQFDPMRQRLYQDQAGWRNATDPSAFFTRIASEEGLDTRAFTQCLDDEEAMIRVWQNTQLGQMGGVTGAPAFLVDGFLVSGALPLEAFRDLLDLKLSSVSAGN